MAGVSRGHPSLQQISTPGAAHHYHHHDLFQCLPKLRAIILHECEAWSKHMRVSRATQYSDIITNAERNPKDIEVKARALIYLLETMPARYAALAATNQAGSVELSEVNHNLLAQLKHTPRDAKLLKAHAYLLDDPDTARQVKLHEDEMAELEQLHMENLSKLRKHFLTRVFEDFKRPEDVVAVIESMRAIGIVVDDAMDA